MKKRRSVPSAAQGTEQAGESKVDREAGSLAQTLWGKISPWEQGKTAFRKNSLRSSLAGYGMKILQAVTRLL